jgi:hypothetical protein
MAFISEEVVGIKTVDDLIAALEEFPGELPVRVGAEERLRVRIVRPAPGEATQRRGDVIWIEGDRNAA